MDANASPKTLQEAVIRYADPVVCQAELVAARWPDGVICPTCGSTKVRFLTNQNRWQCAYKHSRRQFSIKVGTIFEDSPISLSKWFVAIWLIGSAKNGISSYEIARGIGVTQKTAWFMLHRVRLAMQTQSFTKMSGEVEIDETYVGGKITNMHKARQRKMKAQRFAGKVAVMGMLERNAETGSTVRTRIVRGTKRQELYGIIRQNVEEQTNIYTDALPSYTSMNSRFVHQFVDHTVTYANGLVHTNGLENFWALLKRALKGTYVSVEPFHLFRYVDEEAFRFNSRKETDGERFGTMTKRVIGKRLTYADLTGKTDVPEQSA